MEYPSFTELYLRTWIAAEEVSLVFLRHLLLSFPYSSITSDNNDGISVIDVTDPSNPSYCFVSVTGLESSVEVPRKIPLTATDYIRAYYPVPDPKDQKKDANGAVEPPHWTEKLAQDSIAALEGEKVMTLAMLAEAWPSEYEQKLKKLEQERVAEDASVSGAAAPSSNVADSVDSVLVPSLTELTLKPALDHALETGDTQELEKIIWMPGRASAVRSALLSRNEESFSDAGMSLLAEIALESKSDTLDLSGFNLSVQQITDIVSKMETPVRILKLSGNKLITDKSVSDILGAIPTMRRLWLLDTNIGSEDLLTLLVEQPKLFYGIETIVHDLFMHMYSRSPYPTAFSFSLWSSQAKTRFSLPFFTPSSILQCLTDALSGYAAGNRYDTTFSQSAMVPHIALASVRDEGQEWNERFVHLIPPNSPYTFGGEGWGFVFAYSMSAKLRYTFVNTRFEDIEVPKTKTEDTDEEEKEATETETKTEANEEKETRSVARFSIYDLESFLKAMKEDGRPEPSKGVLEKFSGILKKMEEGGGTFIQDEKEFVELLRIGPNY